MARLLLTGKLRTPPRRVPILLISKICDSQFNDKHWESLASGSGDRSRGDKRLSYGRVSERQHFTYQTLSHFNGLRPLKCDRYVLLWPVSERRVTIL